jgi:hypothetical protein
MLHDDQTMLRKYEIIRSFVSAQDVARIFGIDMDAHGRCQCPFHNGTDRNMKIYDGDRGFYCFVCHVSGDCIKLAQKLLGDETRYSVAAMWIDEKFILHLFDKELTPWERVNRAEARARQNRRNI